MQGVTAVRRQDAVANVAEQHLEPRRERFRSLIIKCDHLNGELEAPNRRDQLHDVLLHLRRPAAVTALVGIVKAAKTDVRFVLYMQDDEEDEMEDRLTILDTRELGINAGGAWCQA